MTLRRWIVGVFVFVAIVVTAWVTFAQAGASDITGYYNEKDGEFTKISKNGDLYQYLNHQKAGDWIGVGIRDGDSLSIGWQRSDGKNLGVSIYKIVKGATGPALVGEWAGYPGGRSVKDTLTWVRVLESSR